MGVYSLGYVFSNPKDDEIKYIKNIRVNRKIKRILLPDRLSENNNPDRMNLAGVIWHMTVTISFLLLSPYYLVLVFIDLNQATRVMIAWVTGAGVISALLIILLSLDFLILWIEKKRTK